MAVPEQAAPVLGAAGSTDRSVVMGEVVRRAAHRPKTRCEQCIIKRKKCPPNCPTLAAEPMALMPESARGEPSSAQASSAPTRRVSSRGKAPRNAYPESLERRERATGKRRLELGVVFEREEEVEEEEEGGEGGEEAEEEGDEEGEGDEGDEEGEGDVIKVDSEGNVHYEKWKHPSGELTVLTKPKILTVAFTWLRVDEVPNGHIRYVLSMADYQRMTGAVKPLM